MYIEQKFSFLIWNNKRNSFFKIIEEEEKMCINMSQIINYVIIYLFYFLIF